MSDKELLLKMLDTIRDAIEREDWLRVQFLSFKFRQKAMYLGDED